MSINQQKAIWDKSWEHQTKTNPEEILNSRFTKEAYYCLKNFIDDRKDKLILEAGCGTGRLCCWLAKGFLDSQVVGMDISQNSLKIACRLKKYIQASNVTFEMGTIFQMPYPNNYFDVVFNEGVIEHFSLEDNPTYKDALKEMIRVTKPRGKVIVSVPNWYCFPHTSYKWLLKKLGKQYKYGYEKSFKYCEMMDLFTEFDLQNIEFSAFYPAHGFYRLSGESFYKIFHYLGKLTDLIQHADYLFNKNFTKKFGFEIVIKGVKP